MGGFNYNIYDYWPSTVLQLRHLLHQGHGDHPPPQSQTASRHLYADQTPQTLVLTILLSLPALLTSRDRGQPAVEQIQSRHLRSCHTDLLPLQTAQQKVVEAAQPTG